MANIDLKQITIDSYNNSAKELAEYFKGIGSRVDDIEEAIKFSKNKQPDVLEIGCGDGRDASEIVKRVKSYFGFDISSELIKIAKQTVTKNNAKFSVADATQFDYGRQQYDIVFAFASLLHLDKDELEDVIKKVHTSLRPNGVFFISLKYSKAYEEKIKKDRFGVRQFFFYNVELVSQLNHGLFTVVDMSKGFVTGGDTKWIDLLLIKE